MLFDYKASDSLIKSIDMSSKFDPGVAGTFERAASNLSSGTIINNVIDSVKDKDIGIIDVISLKPFPEQIFDIIKDVENVIIIEEHSVTGGLGSIFSDQANILNLKFNIHLIGFENKQILEYGSREWFYNKSGLDVKSLTKSTSLH